MGCTDPRTSQVPGEPRWSVCHVPYRRRQDCLHQTIKCSSVAPGMQKAKAPTKGLSALNSIAFGLAAYASPSSLPPPTQDSLPVAGQALLDGLLTRKIPMKGFKAVTYISSPSPKLTWRKHIDRWSKRQFQNRSFHAVTRCQLSFCDTSRNWQSQIAMSKSKSREVV